MVGGLWVAVVYWWWDEAVDWEMDMVGGLWVALVYSLWDEAVDWEMDMVGGLWLALVYQWWDEAADWKIYRVTAGAQSGHHWHRLDRQAHGEVCRGLVDVFLWQLFPGGPHGDFQLIGYLRLRLEFKVLLQHGSPGVVVQWVQIWKVWETSILPSKRFTSTPPAGATWPMPCVL